MKKLILSAAACFVIGAICGAATTSVRVTSLPFTVDAPLKYGADSNNVFHLGINLPAVPRGSVETVALSTVPRTAMATGGSQYTYTTQKTPAANTLMFVWYRSSVVGQDYFTAIYPAVMTAQPKQVLVAIPGVTNPLTAGDTLTVAYWSTQS